LTRPFLIPLAAKAAKIAQDWFSLDPKGRLGRRTCDGRSLLICEIDLMEDRLLVGRCKKGDRQALRRIYEKYRDDLLILAVALCRDVNMAEDAVHDVFVAFARACGQLQLRKSLRAYLATSVANRVRDLIRVKPQPTSGPALIDLACSHTSEPDHAVAWNEQLEDLSAALAQLPHEQREVVVLHIYGRMRFRVVAESLGVSVNTAKSRYRYAIIKLRSILDGEVPK
jgi:RNA polymerase sigma-70 factor (ECF subfamily)